MRLHLTLPVDPRLLGDPATPRTEGSRTPARPPILLRDALGYPPFRISGLIMARAALPRHGHASIPSMAAPYLQRFNHAAYPYPRPQRGRYVGQGRRLLARPGCKLVTRCDCKRLPGIRVGGGNGKMGVGLQSISGILRFLPSSVVRTGDPRLPLGRHAAIRRHLAKSDGPGPIAGLREETRPAHPGGVTVTGQRVHSATPSSLTRGDQALDIARSARISFPCSAGTRHRSPPRPAAIAPPPLCLRSTAPRIALLPQMPPLSPVPPSDATARGRAGCQNLHGPPLRRPPLHTHFTIIPASPPLHLHWPLPLTAASLASSRARGCQLLPTPNPPRLGPSWPEVLARSAGRTPSTFSPHTLLSNPHWTSLDRSASSPRAPLHVLRASSAAQASPGPRGIIVTR